ncbi:dirigent protein 2-like [Musa acuminata AAA Group]|uniref:dirigent protein 2-like n=1 Tax=Musa acuminata AAA Group TaxID=214697 RepID=UPI0031D6C5FD
MPSTPFFSPYPFLMASRPSNPSPSLLFLFLFMISSGIAAQKTTHLHFYFHETVRGPDATSIVVASLHKNSSTFGDIHVFDNALRESADPSSKLIGRAQGLATSSSLTDLSALTAINLVFTAGELNGSTLSLFGRVEGVTGPDDRSIVGGSGLFRLARGFALSRTVNISSTGYIVEFDVYVKHYY